ncbi:MAG TPA: DNA polymerase III subunit gamma/tau [Rhabdochlamydiaceae bacterium]|nr:DNA polymerase III subunit gamma/tau [Rhabdochlamydiaceae bacterium]
MYQNISRKYRPQTFKSIVGQDAIVTTLKNAIKLGKIAPAYLFCGCRGTGKTTLARLFAKALNCQALEDDGEPCNECPSCLDITQGRSLDVMEIDGASNRGIDDIRQINETVAYASASSKYKIYIIDEVHMLTKEAFNALLKTLEEPPSTVKFFFATTEPHKVLPTITSRCQRYDLHRLTADQIIAKLGQIGADLGAAVEPEALQLIAHVAEGGLRDAESLLDQLLCYTNGPLTYDETAKILGISPRSMYFQLDQAIESYNLSFAFELATEVFSSGKDLSVFLDGLIEHYRSILLLKMQLPAAAYINEKDRKEYSRAAAFYTQEHCLYILDYLLHWYKEIHRTPFKRITLEMIFLHLIRSQKRISLPTLVRRLEEIESGAIPRPVEKKVEVPSTPFHQNLVIGPRQSPGIEIVKDRGSVAETQPLSLTTQSQELSHQLQEQNLLSTLSKPIPPAPKVETPPKVEVVQVPRPKPEPATVQMEIPAPKVEVIPPKAESQPIEQTRAQKNRYATLLRFAAVELEGSLKKDF